MSASTTTRPMPEAPLSPDSSRVVDDMADFQAQLLMQSGIASQSFDSVSDREMGTNNIYQQYQPMSYPRTGSAVPPTHSASSTSIRRVRRPRASREERRSNSHEAHNPNHHPRHHQHARRNLSIDNFFDPNSPVPDAIAMDPVNLQLQHQRLQEQQQQLLQQQMQLQQLMQMQQQQQQQQQFFSQQQQRPPPPRKGMHRRANSDSASFIEGPPASQRISRNVTPPSSRGDSSQQPFGVPAGRPRLNSADAALVRSSSSSSLLGSSSRPELTKTSSGRGPELQSIAQTFTRLTPPPSPFGSGSGRPSPMPSPRLLSAGHPLHSIRGPNQQLFTLHSQISDAGEMESLLLNNRPTNPSFNNYNSVLASSSPYPNNNSKRHANRQHMRHHSAQLAMTDIKGTVQKPKCHHVLFVFLFYAQLIAMLVVSTTYGHSAMTKYHNAEVAEVESYILQYPHVLQMAICAGFFACAFSGLTLLLLTVFSSDVIQICLIFSIIMSFAWGTVGIGFQPTSFVPITGIIALAFCIGYAFVVWGRIPFAAANLKCGLAGVPLGLVLVSYMFQIVALGWSIVWTFGLLGLYDYLLTENTSTKTSMFYFLFAISYWWTLQVIKNVIQVTVAGAVGQWWSTQPRAYRSTANNNINGDVRTCCPKEVQACFRTAMTYSFGSICYGSLLVDVIHVLRQVCEPMRPKDSPSLLIVNECMLPLQHCLFSWIDYLVQRFNQWSFTYVGLYNYEFSQASLKAMQVLETRGWTNIVTDDLLNNVLTIFSLAIGGCTGCFCALLERIDNYQLASVSNPTALSFA